LIINQDDAPSLTTDVNHQMKLEKQEFLLPAVVRVANGDSGFSVKNFKMLS
jgi:hypothetical protein